MHMLGVPTLPLVKNPQEIQNQHLLIGRSGIPISFRIFHSLLWSTQWQPTPVFLPGESHGWRSLMGYSPRGCKESDATKQLHFHFTFIFKIRRLSQIIHLESESSSALSDSLWPVLQARILESVAFPFSRGSSQPRDQTQVSYIAGRSFANWAIRDINTMIL